MSIYCGLCPIDTKLQMCCGHHPETGPQVPLTIDSGKKVYACPELKSDGLCKKIGYEGRKIKDERPQICQRYECFYIEHGVRPDNKEETDLKDTVD